ncbi:MAG: SDR family NAD(P)-dependent oxidoreductase, partial [Pseudomonadota bacterium]
MSLLLENKIALVTGASHGIGNAVAKRYAKEGAHVIIAGRTISALESLYDEIEGSCGNATIAAFDITDYNKIDELGAQISERFGRLDILVGNAAILGDLTPLPHLEPNVWEKTLATNLTSNWRLIRSFDPLLKLSNAARVIFVTSGVTKSAHP